MINGNITRTFYTVSAFGFVMDGMLNGMPNMVCIHSDEYVTVNPNDKAQMKRELKKVNKKVLIDTIDVDIIDEQVISMSLEDFYNNGTAVERAQNGCVKK